MSAPSLRAAFTFPLFCSVPWAGMCPRTRPADSHANLFPNHPQTHPEMLSATWCVLINLVYKVHQYIWETGAHKIL